MDAYMRHLTSMSKVIFDARKFLRLETAVILGTYVIMETLQ